MELKCLEVKPCLHFFQSLIHNDLMLLRNQIGLVEEANVIRLPEHGISVHFLQS